jgi:hypothetical protein
MTELRISISLINQLKNCRLSAEKVQNDFQWQQILKSNSPGEDASALLYLFQETDE